MYGLSNQDSLMHDESKHGRQQKDNEAENAMLNTLLQFHVMSKDVHPQRLHNICAKDLAADAIQESLLHAKSLGENMWLSLSKKDSSSKIVKWQFYLAPY